MTRRSAIPNHRSLSRGRDLYVVEVRKNESEFIKVGVVERGGRRYVDVRLFIRTHELDPGTPTKKGFTLSCQDIPRFREALLDLEAFALNKRLLKRSMS